jgi:hypothetical protein
MSLNAGILTALLAAGTAIAAAPVAGADQPWPVAGAESAADTISDLEAQGYIVGINWVYGESSVSLYRCRVTGIHNPESAPTTNHQNTTVYVDVDCPDHHGW